MSYLGAFCNQMIRFFEELEGSYPEEKSIAMGLEAIRAAAKANPRLVVDMFHEYLYKPANDLIMNRKDDEIIVLARAIMKTRFNEQMPALMIFDKYWPTMSPANREVVWKYLDVLCKLCEKARAS